MGIFFKGRKRFAEDGAVVENADSGAVEDGATVSTDDALAEEAAASADETADSHAAEPTIQQIAALDAVLAACGAVTVAFDGGPGAALVAARALQVLPSAVVSCVFAEGYLQPAAYRQAVERNAAILGVRLDVRHHKGFDKPAVERNEVLRCYRCRTGLFDVLDAAAACDGARIACGYGADVQDEVIKGRKALDEYQVLMPLVQAGITAGQAVAWAHARGLEQYSGVECMATRFPYNHALDRAEIRRAMTCERAAQEVLGDDRVAVYEEDDVLSVVIPSYVARRALVWDCASVDLPEDDEEAFATVLATARRWRSSQADDASRNALPYPEPDADGLVPLTSEDADMVPAWEVDELLSQMSDVVDSGQANGYCAERARRAQAYVRSRSRFEALWTRAEAYLADRPEALGASEKADADHAAIARSTGCDDIVCAEGAEGVIVVAEGTVPDCAEDAADREPFATMALDIRFIRSVADLAALPCMHAHLVVEMQEGRRRRRAAAVSLSPMALRNR